MSFKRKQILIDDYDRSDLKLSRQHTNPTSSIKSRLGGFVGDSVRPPQKVPDAPAPRKKRPVQWSDDEHEDERHVKSPTIQPRPRQLVAPVDKTRNLLSSLASTLQSSVNGNVKRQISPTIDPPRYSSNKQTSPKPAPSGRLERYLHDIDSMTTLTSGLIDTHMHIDFTLSMFHASDMKWSDFCKRFATRFPPCFEGAIASFSNPESFSCTNTMLNETVKADRLWMSFGVHPHFADRFCENALRACLHKYKRRIVALGEIGLDTSTKNQVSLEVQKETFRLQAEIGIECQLPLVIHTRVSNNNEETLKFMRKFVPREYKLHRHCFTGEWEEANDWLSHFRNCYIGFTPLINSQPELMKVAARIPFDRIVLETDAPYFKTGLPALENGGRTVGTVPGDVLYTAVGIAKARNVPLEAVICQTRLNVKNLYGI